MLGFSLLKSVIFFQNFDIGIPSEIAPPSSFYYGETSNNCQHSGDFVGDDIKPVICTRETSELGDEQTSFNLPEQYQMDSNPHENESLVEPSNNENPVYANYSTDEQYMNAVDVSQFGDDFFIEANDLLNPVEADTEGFDILDEYLTFDVDDFTFGDSEDVKNETASDPDTFSQKVQIVILNLCGAFYCSFYVDSLI